MKQTHIPEYVLKKFPLYMLVLAVLVCTLQKSVLNDTAGVVNYPICILYFACTITRSDLNTIDNLYNRRSRWL